MNFSKAILVVGLGTAVAGWGGGVLVDRLAAAQAGSSQSAEAADKGAPPGTLQRSANVFYLKRIGQSGVPRGQEIYFFKCWVCHNEYTVKENFGDKAPFLLLKDLYKQPRLLNGKPVNDETVAEWIRTGDPKMPSYRYTLTEKDLSDLVSYLREACCWDEEKVPANPRYHPE